MRLHCQSLCNIRCCPRTALSHYWNVTRKTHSLYSNNPIYSAVNSNYYTINESPAPTPLRTPFKKSFNNVNSISMRKLFKLFMGFSNIFVCWKKTTALLIIKIDAIWKSWKTDFIENRRFLAIILSYNSSYSVRKILFVAFPKTV